MAGPENSRASGAPRLVRACARRDAGALLVLSIVATCAGLGACAARVPHVAEVQLGRSATLELQGIESCQDSTNGEIALDPNRPLVVLIHGWHSSAQTFRTLVHAFALDGQQTVCFQYDDRERLTRSAARLRDVLARLSRQLREPDVIVIGHSQGGLIARASLTARRDPALRLTPGNYRLVTISSPFGGIRAASSCGSIPYHLVSLGVSAMICRVISGAKWNQIHPRSRLVRRPWVLDPAVREHLSIITDERDTCRRYAPDGQHCLQDDFVFSVAEQRNLRIERDYRVVENAVAAGHVAVVGGVRGQAPKLLELLAQHGFLREPLLEPQLDPRPDRARLTARHGW